ncbi:MAG: NADPH-dependent curcumin reductase CurA [Paraglaciecola psychrophila]|jgi:NADPH-dependent curcumin reductase CurA
MNLINRKVVLINRPEGEPKESDFQLVDEDVAQLNDDEVLIAIDHLSIDAFIRTTLNVDGLHGQAELGKAVMALGTGRVVNSKFEGLNQGDVVFGPVGAQKYVSMHGSAFRKIDNDTVPAQSYLGALGMTTGLTAYAGMILVGEVQQGDTVVVSAAAGAVGNVACQLAKIKGARVIGIAGGAEKVKYLKEIGCDGAIDYKNDDIEARLKELAPDGVNMFFDNVGGTLLDQVLDQIAQGSRVVICGAISQYHHLEEVQGPALYLRVAERNASMRGFTVDRFKDQFGQMEDDLSAWLASGELTVHEQIEEGVDSFPKALAMLFNGGHKGKLLVTP